MLETRTLKRLAGNMLWCAAVAGLSAGLAGALRRYRQHLGIERARSREAESQSIAALQMRDHLMASASHDLKTPLAAIRLLVHVLKREAAKGPVGPEQLQDRLALIEANVNRMSSLISEMLDVARLQSGRPVELNFVETDLVAMAQRVASTLEMDSGRRRIKVEPSDPKLIGLWDADRVERLLTNLVSNGLKYSPAGREVTIGLHRSTRGAKEVAVVEIRDGGVGIAPEDLPRVFDWFYRGRNAQHAAGTGVGLASAKLIVEKHGGSISIKSRPGHGTTVRITLPLQAPRQREQVQTGGAIPAEAEQSSAGRE